MLPGLESYEDDLSPPLHPYSIHRIDIHIHTQTILYVLGVAPRALLCRAKLLHFTEDLSNMSLMCSLFMRGKRRARSYNMDQKKRK